MARVIVIGGPTASGKSGLALALAEQLSGVVINADSMQVYKGLPILTAQPDADDMARCPHRLYGALAADDMCSAARWRDMAVAEIDAAIERGLTPIVVGGTGFYIKALLEGFSPIPDIAPDIRAAAVALQREMGNPAFHAHLAKLDPDSAAKLDPMNTQRVVRAYEVLKGTGQGISAWQQAPRTGAPAHLEFFTAALLPPRDALYASCDTRFAQMLDMGALEETEAFQKTCPPDAALTGALGYDALCAYLAGEMTLSAATEKAAQETRNYAKRQTTWFKNQWQPDAVLEKPDAGALAARLRT